MSAPLPPLLLRGDCLEELRRIPADSVHAVVTDPPYGLANTDPKHANEALARWASGDRAFVPEGRGFMGEAWDRFVPPPAVWDEVMRILLPGGHLLAFAGSRTFDLMGVSIRLAGFEIRDSIAWLYGSGFPKSMDVSKAIDKAAGATREKVRKTGAASAYSANAGNDRPWMQEARENGFIEVDGDVPATDAAREWEGWGTALKPAFEPVVVARKPLGEKTVAANVLAYGTGALNIDACRIEATSDDLALMEARSHPNGTKAGNKGGSIGMQWDKPEGFKANQAGRFPANVILDESQAEALDAQAPKTGAAAKASGPSRSGKSSSAARGMFAGTDGEAPFHADEGGASRFFYVAKAPKSERPVVGDVAHSTVKPLALMRWLIRLVTPPGGCVVDPFTGSGTTLEAAYLEGFESIGVEVTPKYWPLIEARIRRVTERPSHAED